MNKLEFAPGVHLIRETVGAEHLSIAPGAELKAPENNYLCLTVNGCVHALEAGEYQGNVVLSVAEQVVEETYPSVRRKSPIPLETAISVKDGKLGAGVPAAVIHGTVTDTQADGVFIAVDKPDFAGIVVDGKGSYTINNARICLEGEGSNDFVGMGAGVAAIGDADVTINDSEISLSSVTRCAVHVGGTGSVTVNNTKMYNISPSVEMGNWSWGIAIRGTNRLCQLADDGTVHYNGCTMRSNGWGILSVDGSNYAHMFIKDCDMELEGAGSHGYGVFCIGPTDMHLQNTKLTANGFPLLLRGMERKGVLEVTDGCEIRGRRFALHAQGDTGSVVTIKDSSLITDQASLLIKGSTGTVYNIENTVMEPGNGMLLQLIDSDDPGLHGTFVDVSVYDKADTYMEGRNLTQPDPEDDITLNITGCSLKGDLLNSTSNLPSLASKKEPEGLVLRDAKAPGELGNEGKVSGKPPMMGDMPGGPGGAPDGMPPMGGPGGAPGGMPPMGGPGGAPAGMPPMGGPGGPGGAPGGGMPPFMMGDAPKNLALNLKKTSLEGVVSSATQHYREGLKFLEETIREELSNVAQTPAPTVNNGVLVTLDAESSWTVTGDSYITSLTLEPGAKLLAPEGKALKVTVDGKEIAPASGTITGKIHISVA